MTAVIGWIYVHITRKDEAMQIAKVRSIDYFSFSISDDYIYRLSITIVLFKRGLDFMFFERNGMTDKLKNDLSDYEY